MRIYIHSVFTSDYTVWYNEVIILMFIRLYTTQYVLDHFDTSKYFTYED